MAPAIVLDGGREVGFIDREENEIAEGTGIAEDIRLATQDPFPRHRIVFSAVVVVDNLQTGADDLALDEVVGHALIRTGEVKVIPSR